MNRRKLKKSLNLIVETFADTCLELERKSPEKSLQINLIIDDAAELLDDVMHEIGQHSKYLGPELKVHFARIHKDFDTRMEDLEARLEKLAK